MSHPKTRQKCQAPLLKISGVRSRVATPKDKAKAMPSPLAKWFNQVTGVISGDVTPKDYTKTSSPLLKITGIISGVVTPKDKTKPMPSPLAGKKKKRIRMINNHIELGW